MTWKEVDHNLAKRRGSTLKSLLAKTSSDLKIIQSPSDMGVIRNGGRRGSAFGPKVLTNTLLKMARRDISKNIELVVSCLENETIIDFDTFQKAQSKTLEQHLEAKTTIHIGGGHDHIYPLTDALFSKHEKIVVLNLDAHLDTRDDELHHSGTPFRQLSKKYGKRLELIQIGIHDFANSCENYQDLEMKIHTTSELKEKTDNFTDSKSYIEDFFKALPKDALVVLSLDIDAIDGSEMKAVSAVNHDGLPMSFIGEFFKAYKMLEQERKVIGLYEYNPLFDDLGCSGARSLGAVLYEFIR